MQNMRLCRPFKHFYALAYPTPTAMVRKGSPVRVRQRASKKGLEKLAFSGLSDDPNVRCASNRTSAFV